MNPSTDPTISDIHTTDTIAGATNNASQDLLSNEYLADLNTKRKEVIIARENYNALLEASIQINRQLGIAKRSLSRHNTAYDAEIIRLRESGIYDPENEFIPFPEDDEYTTSSILSHNPYNDFVNNASARQLQGSVRPEEHIHPAERGSGVRPKTSQSGLEQIQIEKGGTGGIQKGDITKETSERIIPTSLEPEASFQVTESVESGSGTERVYTSSVQQQSSIPRQKDNRTLPNMDKEGKSRPPKKISWFRRPHTKNRREFRITGDSTRRPVSLGVKNVITEGEEVFGERVQIQTRTSSGRMNALYLYLIITMLVAVTVSVFYILYKLYHNVVV